MNTLARAATAAAGVAEIGGPGTSASAPAADPAAGAAGTETPGTGTPATGTPGTETPATGTHATGTAGTGTSATGTPGTETPATGTHATGTAGTGTHATGTPATGTPGRMKRLGGTGHVGRGRDRAPGRHRRPRTSPARPSEYASAVPARRRHLLPAGRHRRAGRARLLGRWVLSLGRPGRAGIQVGHDRVRRSPAAAYMAVGNVAAARRPGGLPGGSGFASF
jgi:hypothetical protein